jgi:broad specificity phosphatase PhoE
MESLQDAPLSAKGFEQVRQLRKKVQAMKLPNEAQLIVTSPLTRALQTTAAFDGLVSCRVIGENLSPCVNEIVLIILL